MIICFSGCMRSHHLTLTLSACAAAAAAACTSRSGCPSCPAAALDSQLQGQNGSDAGSQLNTPNSTSVMNLGPGSLGQLFDWGAGQGQQPGAGRGSTPGGALTPYQ